MRKTAGVRIPVVRQKTVALFPGVAELYVKSNSI
jgi:hypothetical protein